MHNFELQREKMLSEGVRLRKLEGGTLTIISGTDQILPTEFGLSRKLFLIDDFLACARHISDVLVEFFLLRRYTEFLSDDAAVKRHL